MIKDNDGVPSVTTTAFVLGFLLASAKFALSSMTILGFAIPVFGAAEYTIALTALGGIYILRNKDKATTKKKKVTK